MTSSKYQLTAQDYRDLYSLLLGIKDFKSKTHMDGTVPYCIYNIGDVWLQTLITKMSNRMDEFDASTTGPKMKFS